MSGGLGALGGDWEVFLGYISWLIPKFKVSFPKKNIQITIAVAGLVKWLKW
jgi:hypothetical protein